MICCDSFDWWRRDFSLTKIFIWNSRMAPAEIVCNIMNKMLQFSLFQRLYPLACFYAEGDKKIWRNRFTTSYWGSSCKVSVTFDNVNGTTKLIYIKSSVHKKNCTKINWVKSKYYMLNKRAYDAYSALCMVSFSAIKTSLWRTTNLLDSVFLFVIDLNFFLFFFFGIWSITSGMLSIRVTDW